MFKIFGFPIFWLLQYLMRLIPEKCCWHSDFYVCHGVFISICIRGRCGRDRMVVGFTTTYAISAYHHWCCEFESRSGRGVQHNVKVCQWLATGWWFSLGPPVSSTNKTDRHDITEILLKVALNTIKQNKLFILVLTYCLSFHSLSILKISSLSGPISATSLCDILILSTLISLDIGTSLST